MQHLLQTTSGLECLVNLVEIDLSNNCISQLQGLAGLKYLRKLVLTCNRIRAVDDLSDLNTLEHLLLQGNPIARIQSINLAMLSGLKSLKSLYLRNVDGSKVCPALYCLSALHFVTTGACLGSAGVSGLHEQGLQGRCTVSATTVDKHGRGEKSTCQYVS